MTDKRRQFGNNTHANLVIANAMQDIKQVKAEERITIPLFQNLPTDTFSGILPQIARISDREILIVTHRYKALTGDQTPDAELRPKVINTIIHDRKKYNEIDHFEKDIVYTEITSPTTQKEETISQLDHRNIRH